MSVAWCYINLVDYIMIRRGNCMALISPLNQQWFSLIIFNIIYLWRAALTLAGGGSDTFYLAVIIGKPLAFCDIMHFIDMICLDDITFTQGVDSVIWNRFMSSTLIICTSVVIHFDWKILLYGAKNMGLYSGCKWWVSQMYICITHPLLLYPILLALCNWSMS